MMRVASVFVVLLVAVDCQSQVIDLQPLRSFQTRFVESVDPNPQTRLVPVETKTGFANQHPTKWRYTPRQDYHAAVVGIRCPIGIDGNPAAGTGTLVALESGSGVVAITNHHVVSLGWIKEQSNFHPDTHNVVTIKGNPGSVAANVVWSNQMMDLAILHAPNATAKVTLPISAVMPKIGESVEFAGYGGPTDGLRTFTAPRVESGYGLSIDAPVVSGDSGGPMIWQGAIVGVNFGAPGKAGSRGLIRTNHAGDWHLSGPASSNVDGPTLARVLTQRCLPLGCRPRIIYAQPVQPITPTPPQSKCDCPSTDEIVALVLQQIPSQPQVDVNVIVAEVLRKMPNQQPVDYDDISQYVIARIPPMHMRRVNGQTKELISDEEIHPGEGWTFYETPGVVNSNARQPN